MATRIPIPQFQQRQQTPIGMPVARTPMVAVDDPTGRALASAGNTLGQIGDAAQRVQREQSIAWVSKASSDDQIKWLQRMTELQDTAQPGAPDFTPKFLEEFDTYASEAVQNAPPEARNAYRESLTRQRTYFGQNAVTFQATREREHTVSQYQGGLESDAAAIALDPSLYGERRAFRLAALGESSLPSQVRAKLTTESEAAMAFAAGAATIDRDPHGAVSAINAAAQGQVTTGYEWVGRLDADRLLQLRTRAHTQADRIDNRARVEQDRSLARAQRAIGELDKQVATGVPARTDDMLRWAGMVAGTEYEGAYRDMMKGQEEVQQVLRMPIPEQAAFIQRRRQDQQRAGASTTDVANLDRLSRAVESNTKMLRESPLAWVENRAAQEIPRLQPAALSEPGGSAVIGQVLRGRGDVIRGLRRANPDGLVQMRPLFADEAQQISNTFQQGGARQKRELLGNLFWASDGPDLYQGVIDQVEGLSPFMGRLGRLAGSYESAKLTNNWFSADVVQSAGDAAALAIHGDEILRNGGKDGTISYPVPKDTEFTQAIQDRVGSLYRGAAPGDSGAQEFMQDAYAVKAYYVGKAAQEGDLAADVNTDRLDQAIIAVLGQPVNFHGNGQVLAPWGLNEADFRSRANRAIFQEFEARGLQDQMGRSMGNVGLFGVGAGTYAVTLGGTPVRDPRTGEPVIITMTPDADQGRDAFGGRLADQIPGASGSDGMLESGNIDLNARPVVRNPDGSISTVRSMSIEEDGQEVLIPTVSEDGKVLDDDSAVSQYRRTGRHLGRFSSPEAATRYAEQLHRDQERQYGGRQ
ncbi:hypothetical protein [Orrella dioscoreae]|nr:hypothetical protein [Orrella dioscoreae]